MATAHPPAVSIVLPTLNGRRYIAQSIQSCLGQSFSDFELIVVDGGSTDDTLQIVRSFADARISVVQQPDNSGRLPGALNCGFASARGCYFTWTQDDDLYAPDALATLVSALEAHPEAGLVYAGMTFIDGDGAVCRNEAPQPPEALFWMNPVGCCFMYRRSVAEAVGPYDPKYFMSEDTHYWLRIYKHFKIIQLPEQLYYHRLHPASLTVKNYGAFRALRVAAKARLEVLGINWRQYNRQVSAAFIEEAFQAHNLGDWKHILPCLVRGVMRNPAWLTNRGVWSIGRSALLRPRPRHD